MYHYGLLTISVIMFGFQFYFNDMYKKENGSDSVSAFVLTFISGVAGVISLLLINGFSIEATPFTLIISSVSACNSILYSFCSLKALARINLSLYSLFAMLGGMVLPFFQGIIFYNEDITVAKILCMIFVILALGLTVEKGEKRGGTLYYAGVFVLNGMSGVLSKIFKESAYDKTSDAMYSIWIAMFAVLISGIVLLCMLKKLKLPNFKALLYGVGYGSITRVANYLLLIALAVLPASVQYPFITGGVMIVSTVFSVIMGQKPSKKEVLSVALSFVGILLLVFIPI